MPLLCCWGVPDLSGLLEREREDVFDLVSGELLLIVDACERDELFVDDKAGWEISLSVPLIISMN